MSLLGTRAPCSPVVTCSAAAHAYFVRLGVDMRVSTQRRSIMNHPDAVSRQPLLEHLDRLRGNPPSRPSTASLNLSRKLQEPETQGARAPLTQGDLEFWLRSSRVAGVAHPEPSPSLSPNRVSRRVCKVACRGHGLTCQAVPDTCQKMREGWGPRRAEGQRNEGQGTYAHKNTRLKGDLLNTETNKVWR